jgi:pimeloyl-ACP methyl ester carboxylesterase
VTEPTSRTIKVPGATLTYDVRSNGSSAAPALLIIGSPMGAGGFVTLAGHFPDRTVVTYDPRGVERSPKTDDTSESTPDEHADDVHAVIQAIGGGPVDLFATSGGAVNSLALVARHPEDVRILVAHEPALGEVLSDRDTALAAAEGIQKTYRSSGFGPAMAKFIALVTHKGGVPAGFADGPGPDPAMFGLPTEDDGTRNDPLVGQNIVSSTHYKPDFDAIRAAATRIVVAVGAESDGEMAHRGGVGVAERLGTTPVTFPSGHGGFLGGEYGQTGEPEAFAKALREALETGN